MKTRHITKSAVFPASGQEVFKHLQKLSTLQHIAFPYATFKPVDCRTDIIWQEDKSFDFRFRLFSLIPFDIQNCSSTLQLDSKPPRLPQFAVIGAVCFDAGIIPHY